MVTLLRVLRDERRLTQTALLDRLERRARELGEREFSLSARQLARLETGEIKSASRPANIRILEAELGHPFEDLVAPGDRHRPSPAVTALPPPEVPPAEHFAAVVGHLARLDHRDGPATVLDPAVSIYRSVRTEARHLDGPARDEHLRVAARAAELIGWLHQDSGRPADAREWTADALDLAETARAGELVAYILMRRASVEIDLRRAEPARLLAERSLRHGRSAAERALALREVAAAHALDGTTREFRRAVDQALDHAHAARDSTPLAPYCTPAFLRSEAGASALHLGDAHLALAYLEPAAREWPAGQERDRTLCLARLALARARAGQADTAADAALAAAGFRPALRPPRLTAALSSVVQSLSEQGAERWALQLSEQLTPVA